MPNDEEKAYKIRDNQFWYSRCSFSNDIDKKKHITIRITGPCEKILKLEHSEQGGNPQPTKSFRFIKNDDREWWKQHNKEIVQIELLNTDNESAAKNGESPEDGTSRPKAKDSNKKGTLNLGDSTLCIGLDIAWFGGSSNNADSQHDCLGWISFPISSKKSSKIELGLNRFKLPRRDPDASVLLREIRKLLSKHKNSSRIVFAIDAPIQAYERSHLPTRKPAPGRGEIERRACENYFSIKRQLIDAVAGGPNGWHPNIQPGAPLAPRIQCLLKGLSQLDFELWEVEKKHAKKLVIECFPAEAIWSMKRLGYYPDNITAKETTAYKSNNFRGQHLTAEEVGMLVRNVLNAFALSTGLSLILDDTLDWMLKDKTESWQTPNSLYRAGKLLDDVVDTAICLATSVSYAYGDFHVWQDESCPEDGHIIGPGGAMESLL